MFDDSDPKPKPSVTRVLDSMSVAELETYIDELEGEIKRVHLEIRRKNAQAETAAAMFRKNME